MHYEEFIGHVQHRARLPSRQAAERAARATLETLAEHLTPGAANALASQLPPDMGPLLVESAHSAHMTLHECFEKVARREGTNIGKAAFHVRAVIDVLREAVSPGAFHNATQQLPQEYWRVLTGAHGHMPGKS